MKPARGETQSHRQLTVLTVIGARPQFIKASAVSDAFRRMKGVREIVVNTGQHYDTLMADVFFAELQIPPPNYNLEVGSGSHAVQTARILERVEAVLLEERPDCVLVYGDTNTTIAAALAAAKLHIPVAHIEAGLRSFNRCMPEEINRVVTDHLSDLLFPPCNGAAAQLTAEGIAADRIFQLGDVMYDVALRHREEMRKREGLLTRLGVYDRDYVLCTVHRAENTNDPAKLRNIVGGLERISAEIPVIFPVHPRTKKAMSTCGMNERRSSRLRTIDPLGYIDMAVLQSHAAVVATDSGGVQKEAFFFGTPCVTLRDETEWTELVDLGWNRLVSPVSSEAVADGIRESIGKRGITAIYPYGDGLAAEKISSAILMRYRKCSSAE
jgi:UDP-GlcNAc3NAcA epimerase